MRKRDLPWRIRQASEARKESPLVSFAKPVASGLIVGALTAMLAFQLGISSEQRKERVQGDRLAVENRRKVFVATTQDFSTYVTQWSRLRTVSAIQQKLQDQIDQLKSCPATAKKPQAKAGEKGEMLTSNPVAP